jgi:hypothetical protein
MHWEAENEREERNEKHTTTKAKHGAHRSGDKATKEEKQK